MKWWWKEEPKLPPKEERPTLEINASDDLLKRAENIVSFLGFRGMTGDMILEVHRLLKAYERLDKAAEAQNGD